MVRTVYLLERKQCPKCQRFFAARAPGVFPKGLYGNQLLTHVAVQHCLYGVSLGRLKAALGKLAMDPTLDPYVLLFPPDTS
jgi:hypothetical protein